MRQAGAKLGGIICRGAVKWNHFGRSNRSWSTGCEALHHGCHVRRWRTGPDRGRSEELDLHLGLAVGPRKDEGPRPKGPLLRLWWPWWAFSHPIKPQAGRAQAACPFGNRWRDFLREHEHLEAPSPHSLHRSVPLQRTEQQQHAHNPLQALLTAAANGQKSTKTRHQLQRRVSRGCAGALRGTSNPISCPFPPRGGARPGGGWGRGGGSSLLNRPCAPPPPPPPPFARMRAISTHRHPRPAYCVSGRTFEEPWLPVPDSCVDRPACHLYMGWIRSARAIELAASQPHSESVQGHVSIAADPPGSQWTERQGCGRPRGCE